MLTKNKRVILIDDAAWEQVAGKLKALFGLQGFALDVFNTADEFGKFLDAATGPSPADIYVVDVMIPPGDRYKKEETHDGLITGLYLAREIRQRFPLVPIILWSGTNLDTVRLLAVHMEKRLTKCIFVKKRRRKAFRADRRLFREREIQTALGEKNMGRNRIAARHRRTRYRCEEAFGRKLIFDSST